MEQPLRFVAKGKSF